jgi:Na+/H+ antiporter NhaD/arsenite permease-like protein
VNDVAITFTIVAAIVLLFIWDQIPVVLVALGTPLALYFTGILDLGHALAGLGDPAVIFIASLFIVSGGLEAAGVTAWAGQLLIAKAGESRTRLLVLMMLLVALVTALISVNGAVAALLPVVVVAAIRLGQPTSQLLMPLVFAAHAGSMLAFTGTPVNVIVNEAAVDAGVRPFGYFEFALVGIPLLAGTMAIVVLFGRHLLPNRSGRALPADLSRHARTLIEQYRLADGFFKLRVRAGSPYIGVLATAIDLKQFPGLALVGAQTGTGAVGRGRTRRRRRPLGAR